MPGPAPEPYDDEVAQFFRDFSAAVRRYLVSGCGCPAHDADDVVQEAFLAVRSQWDRVRTLERPQAYLYKVATRRFSRLQQQRTRESWDDLDKHVAAYPEPSDALAAADHRDDALFLLRQLPQPSAGWSACAASASAKPRRPASC
jgi:DNA-directed RNA polymerase specialized sigma24 family protein